MANRMISDQELALLLAVCDGLNEEDSLAQKFSLGPHTISAMVQTLISPTPYCGTGLLMADMTRLGGSTVEHARNIRLTPLGRTVCQTKSKIVQC
ncbi:MAG: hypothetical protein C7B43_20995 [Sulfobacillus benefaciens]|uniref:Uncharacterized protein n=1 Tax=Sulfobacillus benefaciens TaxID=453960 RepID=A0A2T2WID4_9FIRM|nr:MAG: hypothetical protein C7B43_20995 [Sulfobacillus benefaciens]